MKIFGYEIRREQKAAQFETVLQRILAARYGSASVVTPDNCEASPTVKAIVTAISNRLAVTPVHVYRTGTSRGRETKEKLPDHPVQKLLDYPNENQTRTSFWADAASSLVRYGNFYAYKGRGSTGPIRFLQPMKPGQVTVDQDPETGRVVYRYGDGAYQREYALKQLLHVRGTARDFVCGDSPVRDVSGTIALEIAAEQFGLSFFQNGALPLMMFHYTQGSQGFKTAEQERQFIADFQEALGGGNRHRAMLLPKGVETGDPIRIENDKAQMIESRRYQRTVIAGAFGVPPQYVGDLERATFNNAEQQSLQFTSDVIMPVAQRFEAALERDLLTEEDWRGGIVIRFNLDSILRADFKSRQEGLQIQRQNGIVSADEWREIEGRNPISEEDGGAEYWRPSNMAVAGQPVAVPAAAPKPAEPAASEPKQVIHLHNSTHVASNVEPQSIAIGPTEVRMYPAETQINVQARSEPPQVKVAAPIVNVEPPQVRVINQVDVPEVTVKNEVRTPDITIPTPQVSIQPITIKAPDVTVRNELPDYEQIEAEAVRDATGRLVKTVTTKKRRK